MAKSSKSPSSPKATAPRQYVLPIPTDSTGSDFAAVPDGVLNSLSLSFADKVLSPRDKSSLHPANVFGQATLVVSRETGETNRWPIKTVPWPKGLAGFVMLDILEKDPCDQPHSLSQVYDKASKTVVQVERSGNAETREKLSLEVSNLLLTSGLALSKDFSTLASEYCCARGDLQLRALNWSSSRTYLRECLRLLKGECASQKRGQDAIKSFLLTYLVQLGVTKRYVGRPDQQIGHIMTDLAAHDPWQCLQALRELTQADSIIAVSVLSFLPSTRAEVIRETLIGTLCARYKDLDDALSVLKLLLGLDETAHSDVELLCSFLSQLDVAIHGYFKASDSAKASHYSVVVNLLDQTTRLAQRAVNTVPKGHKLSRVS
ncbi:MAG TPA: hypothetical protein VNT75_32105, partial [Symbiobacteriaceae bacterium]|nr:hypothetical protein [Symbiobacteriaceae bacterium]